MSGNQQGSPGWPMPGDNELGQGRELREGGSSRFRPGADFLVGRHPGLVAAVVKDPGAMERTRDAILDALENLTAEEFKKFKLKLLSVPLREGYGRIPRGTLLPMDAVDLTDKLVSFYLDAYGAELTALVLREMGMLKPAEQLQIFMGKGPRAAPAGIKAPPEPAAKPALHFVDQHRSALITRVTDVDGVLDALYGKILTEEQYQAVRAETTNPMKIRKLFSFAPAWNQTCKDLLLQALRDTQPYLVNDLEQS